MPLRYPKPNKKIFGFPVFPNLVFLISLSSTHPHDYKSQTSENRLGSFSLSVPIPKSFSKFCHFYFQNIFQICLLFFSTFIATTLFQATIIFCLGYHSGILSFPCSHPNAHLVCFLHSRIRSGQVMSFPCLKLSSGFPQTS